MINSKKIQLIVLGVFLLIGSMCYAQRGKGNGHHGQNRHRNGNRHHRVKVHHSVFRPKVVAVYHPHWGSNRNYNRRWVYFPRYNFYWDNWRQVYVYRNANVWISNPTPPPTVVNININNEKNYELKETEDDEDDVYKTNDTHSTEYKP